MGVLWWLAAPMAITGLAMAWAAWAGRPRDERNRRRDDADRARLAAALARPAPAKARRIVVQPSDPPRGVAVRPSTRTPTPRRESRPRR